MEKLLLLLGPRCLPFPRYGVKVNLFEDLNDPNLRLIELESGSVVPQRIVDIVETIREIWHGRVDVDIIAEWYPNSTTDKYCVVEVLPNGKREPIFFVKDDSEFTGEVIERLYLADNSKGNVLTRMQARNAAVRALQKKVAKDKMAEAHDIAASVMKSPLNWYRLGKGKVIKDHGNG